MQGLSFGFKILIGAVIPLALIACMISPVFGTIILSFIAMALMALAMTRKVWTFLAPERIRFTQTMQQSVQDGPISGGFVPLLASFMLMALIVISAFGGL